MARSLDSITDKADSLSKGMSKDLIERLDARLEAASPQGLQAMKDLLHFSWSDRSGTTEESRNDIRKALVTYLAHGGSIAGASQLREAMKGMTPVQLQDFSQKLRRDPGDDFAFHTARQLLPYLDPQDNASLKATNDIIQGVQADVRRGVSHVNTYKDESLALNYVKPGKLEFGRREDLINEACDAYRWAGGSEENEAAFRQILEKKSLGAAASIVSVMRDPQGGVVAGVASSLSVESYTPKLDLQELEPVLLGLPADPAKAGQPMYASGSISVERDDQGALVIANVSAAHVSLRIPEKNKNLSAEKVEELKASFLPIIDTNYSRCGVALDFADSYRQAKLDNPDLSMAEALENYQPDGAGLHDANHSSDCYGQAAAIQREFAKPELDVECVMAGKYCHPNTQQKMEDGSLSNPQDAMLQSGRVTHMDVIVPYTDESGRERVLVFAPGEGKKDKSCQDLSMQEFLAGADAPLMRVAYDPDGENVSLDPAKCQKNALGYRTNLVITNGTPDTPQAKDVAGIDLVGGKVFLSSGASAKFQGPKPLGNQERISFDYRDAINDPEGMITLDFPDGQGGYEPREVTKMEALTAFVDSVGKQFGQSENFTASAMTLMANEEEYQQSVLWPSVQQMHGFAENQALAQNVVLEQDGQRMAQQIAEPHDVSVRDQLRSRPAASGEQRLRDVPAADRQKFEKLQKKISELKENAGNAALEKNFAVDKNDVAAAGHALDDMEKEMGDLKKQMADLKAKNPGLKQLERSTVGRHIHSMVRDVGKDVRAKLGR